MPLAASALGKITGAKPQAATLANAAELHTLMMRFANLAVLAGTFMLAIAISLSVFVVTAVVVSDGWAAATAAAVELMLLALWYALPIALRGDNEG